MAEASDFASCADAERTLLPTDPFEALHYHFGMLLGVDDFETEQAYHRGKMRLHNAWLHREGVVWGLAVQVGEADRKRSELRVTRGLALDPAGHELHLDEDWCINVPAWVEKLPEDERTTLVGDDRAKPFDAHVVIRHRACLGRQVPALMEPCDGAGRDTDYSRVFETVELLLLPGLAPDLLPPPYHRLRLLFGLDPVGEDEHHAPLAEDTTLAAERDAMLAMPRGARLQEALRLLRSCAAHDGAGLVPGQSEDTQESLLFPAADDAGIVLANLSGIQLEAVGDRFVVKQIGGIDYASRPAHVATRTIQELLAAALLCAEAPAFDAASVNGLDSQSVTLKATRDLLAESVTPAAFALASVGPGQPWAAASIQDAQLGADRRTVTLQLQAALAMPAGGAVRLVAFGTGATPILAADLAPLGGDFVFTKKGS